MGAVLACALGLATPSAHAQCPSSFAAAVNYGASTDSRSVAIGDVSGDGRPDLAVSNYYDNNVSVLLNNGPSIGFSPRPQNQSVKAGANAVFTATATSAGPFTYQWRRNGVPIVGATASTLTLTGVTASSAGVYDVQVRGGCNPAAVSTSNPATLMVSTIGAACPADFNNSGVVSVQDIFDFLAAYFTGCP